MPLCILHVTSSSKSWELPSFSVGKKQEVEEEVALSSLNSTKLYYRSLATWLCFLTEDGANSFSCVSWLLCLEYFLNNFFSSLLLYTPGQPVSSVNIETMGNSTAKDEAGHQRVPENPVHKISSSKWICNACFRNQSLSSYTSMVIFFQCST